MNPASGGGPGYARGMPLPISVLDLAPVPAGSTSRDVVRNTTELARHAEALGYHRYWVAEHHNSPTMACPSPEVMIAHIAANTSRIRVGSGGVMLPNHSPLRVAEAFRVLEALHPGRIDLGLGRAPGTDGLTAYAIRRGAENPDFPTQLAELLAFGGEGFPDGHPFAPVAAEPADVPLPPVWILGSSEFGAQVAAAMGTGFAFARHLNPRGAAEIMRMYRERFRPGMLEEPYAILGLSAVCADTSERAHELAWSMALGVLRLRQGRPGPLVPPEVAASLDYDEAELDQIRRYRRAQVLGDPAEVGAELTRLADETAADEVMIMAMVTDHAERMRSYELIAGAMGATAREPAAAAAE